MEEPLAPPTSHVLRPHHVGLLTAFMLIFKEFEIKPLPPSFNLHMYRVLLNEVSEVAPPKSHADFLQQCFLAPNATSEHPRNLLNMLKEAHRDLTTPEQMTNFFGSLPSLYCDKNEDDEGAILGRRSIFGYFCRRCHVSFSKLSYFGVVKLQKDYLAWCAGDSRVGYEPMVKDELNNADMLIFKTQSDKRAWAEPHAYEAWEKGQATGDENIAAENLRRFFEQHFHEGNDSGVRQHALLNLVRMHFLRHEWVAVRKLLSEAITVSRTNGDKLTLQHCIGMLNRLAPLQPNRKPILNQIQPDLNPLEILNDVKKLMQISNDQPLAASFERIAQAIGLYDHWVDVQGAQDAEGDQWAQHVMQAVVWSAAGCDQLAAIEENIVTAFSEVGSDDNNRITAILNRAYKRARQGQYDESIASLLEPDVWRGLTINDYNGWALQIWNILALRASRRGQERLYHTLLAPNQPPGFADDQTFSFFGAKTPYPSKIRSPLYEVLEMRQCEQATTVIEQLLTSLWQSEFQGRMSFYRVGIIMLADIGLEFGMTKRCRRILEEIMPQIINGDDLEQRALACFTLARCIIAAENSTSEALREALQYVLIAEADYEKLEIPRSLMDVQYLLSVIYHNLGMEFERDQAAKRHFATEEVHRRLNAATTDPEVVRVLEVVAQVGSALALR